VGGRGEEEGIYGDRNLRLLCMNKEMQRKIRNGVGKVAYDFGGWDKYNYAFGLNSVNFVSHIIHVTSVT